jgi:coproporphyrinogen III oxidase
VDGQASFHEDQWSYDSGGGGKTRILQIGGVFEKAGVNFSAIEGSLPSGIAARLRLETDPFFATGVSLVIHPQSPLVPIVHLSDRSLIVRGNPGGIFTMVKADNAIF